MNRSAATLRARLRPAIAVVLTTVIAMTAAACGGSDDNGASSGKPDTDLVIGIPTALQCLDPLCGGGKQEQTIRSQIYLSMTEIDPDLKLVGQLAESWENPQPTTWVFHLRDGVTFESGDPLDATEVKANFDRLMGPEAEANSTATADLRKAIKSVEVIDDLTVEIDLNYNWVEFPQRLSTQPFLDTKWAATANPSLEASASGPYRLVSFNPEGDVVLEANPTYYGDQPAYTKVTYRVLSSPSARLSAIQSGEVDVVTGIDPQDMPTLDGSDNLVTGAVESTRSMFMWFNATRAPFNDERVREALNYAVDKQAIIDSVLGGLTSPLKGQLLDSAFSGMNSDLDEFAYDPEKAKELLAEAGYPDGFKMTMSLATGAYVGIDLVGQALAGQLKDIGVDMTVDAIPFANWQETLMGDPKDAYDATLTAFASPSNSNQQMLSYFISDYIQNHADDPAFDALFQQAGQAADLNELISITKQAMTEQHDFAQLLFLFPVPLTYAYNKDVDIPIRPDEWMRASDAKPAA